MSEQEQTQANLIKLKLESIPYPITAAYVGKLLNMEKSLVNRLFSKFPNLFEKLECSPPLWRVRAPVSNINE